MAGYKESYEGKINRKLKKKQKVIAAAVGREKAELVLKNASYLNVFSSEICTGDIAVSQGLIVGIGDYEGEQELDVTGKIVCPGLLDAHIHLESALVSPTEFAKAVVPHGTTTVICDPHEIANVMGTDGIEYMLQATENLPLDVYFMLPSCVPATPMDESGAVLDYRAIDSFFDHARVLGLAEMMNFPGVIAGDKNTVAKIVAAQAHHRKIDGHAPDLDGKALNAYIAAGVYSDHECHTAEDAMQKLRLGQYIMIREGTAARNLEALMPLLTQQYGARCMFCTDDKHPSDLLEKGHMDYIVRRAVQMGCDPILAAEVGCHHAAQYFLLNNRGAIAPGYLADFAIVDNLADFNVQTVIKRGQVVYENGKLKEFTPPKVDDYLEKEAHDTFHMAPVTPESFMDPRPRAILGMIPGEITTTDNGYATGVDLKKDILKIAVIERHKNTGHIGLGYIQGYGLKAGAIATSVSHDSHNIIVVGTNEADMARAANQVAENHGGITVVKEGEVLADLPLEIAGLMSGRTLKEVNDRLENAKAMARSLGVNNSIDPFMTLSFMALPVIPTLRLTTRGVLDVSTQKYV